MIFLLGGSAAGVVPKRLVTSPLRSPSKAWSEDYSLRTRDPERELLPLLRELGIDFVPYSPLGHGFLTGEIRSPEQLSDDNWRRTNPRFVGETSSVTCASSTR